MPDSLLAQVGKDSLLEDQKQKLDEGQLWWETELQQFTNEEKQLFGLKKIITHVVLNYIQQVRKNSQISIAERVKLDELRKKVKR